MRTRLGLLLLGLVLLAAPAWAAIAFDAATSNSSEASGGTTISATHTATGSDRIAVIVVGSAAGTPTNTSSVTYNGVAATELCDIIQEFAHVSLHYIVAPATGAQTVTATLGGTDDEKFIGVFSYTGVDQSTPVGTTVTGQSNTGTPSVTVSSAAGEVVVDGVFMQNTNIDAGTGQTQRVGADGIGGFGSGGGSEEAGAASVAMTWSAPGSSVGGQWVQCGVSLKVASGGGAQTFGFRYRRHQ